MAALQGEIKFHKTQLAGMVWGPVWSGVADSNTSRLVFHHVYKSVSRSVLPVVNLRNNLKIWRSTKGDINQRTMSTYRRSQLREASRGVEVS